eukprot:358352-Chlamydomonas_euryale.AAC.4
MRGLAIAGECSSGSKRADAAATATGQTRQRWREGRRGSDGKRAAAATAEWLQREGSCHGRVAPERG